MDCYGYHDEIFHVDLSARRACIEHAERKGFDDILASTIISSGLLKKDTPNARGS